MTWFNTTAEVSMRVWVKRHMLACFGEAPSLLARCWIFNQLVGSSAMPPHLFPSSNKTQE